MTYKEKIAFRQTRLKDSMRSLIGDQRFQSFMEEVVEQQKGAMLDACHERTLANDRLLSTALGEVRAYQSLLDLYHSFAEQAQAGEEA